MVLSSSMEPSCVRVNPFFTSSDVCDVGTKWDELSSVAHASSLSAPHPRRDDHATKYGRDGRILPGSPGQVHLRSPVQLFGEYGELLPPQSR